MHFLKYFYTRVYTNYPPLKEYIIEILTKFCKQSLSRLLLQSIIKLSRNVNSRKTVSKRKRTKSRYSIAYIHRACITDTFPPFERYTQRSEHVERGEVRGHNKRIPSPGFPCGGKPFVVIEKKKIVRKTIRRMTRRFEGIFLPFSPPSNFFSHSFISIVTLPVRLDSLFRLSNNRNPSFTIQIEYRSSRLPTSPAPPEISYIMRQ